MKLKSFLFLFTLTLLLVSTQSFFLYSIVFDNLFGSKPHYSLGPIRANYTVMINLTSTAIGINSVPINSTDINISIWNIRNFNSIYCMSYNGTSYASSPFNAVYTCTTNTDSIWMLILKLQNYPTTFITSERVGLYTKILQYYQLTVTSYLNSTGGPSNSSAVIKTHFKATDTLRDKVARLIYLNQTDVNITLYPSPEIKIFALYANVTLHPILPAQSVSGSAYDFTDSIPIALTAQTSDDSPIISFTGNISQAGYYLLSANYQQLGHTNFIQIIYPSETYACPYPSSYPDILGNFQPCINPDSGSSSPISNIQLYPCMNYSSTKKQCSQCIRGYILTITGICIFNIIICKPREYYYFGTCKTVDASCDGFDYFTGDCTNCTDPLKYVFNGSCIVKPVCRSGTYLSPSTSTCLSCSSNCVTCSFFTDCISCYPGFYFANNSCSSCPDRLYLQPDLTCGKQCPVRYYADSLLRACQPCPYDCYICDSSGKCLNCNESADYRVFNRQTSRCELKAAGITRMLIGIIAGVMAITSILLGLLVFKISKMWKVEDRPAQIIKGDKLGQIIRGDQPIGSMKQIYKEEMLDPIKPNKWYSIPEEISAKRGCCLCQMQNTVFRTNCGHSFHLLCIIKWFKKVDRCPSCEKLLSEPIHKVYCRKCRCQYKAVQIASLTEMVQKKTQEMETICQNCKLVPI